MDFHNIFKLITLTHNHYNNINELFYIPFIKSRLRNPVSVSALLHISIHMLHSERWPDPTGPCDPLWRRSV